MDSDTKQIQIPNTNNGEENNPNLNSTLTNDLTNGIEISNAFLPIFGFKIPVPKYGFTYEFAKLQANLIKNTFNPEAPRIFGKENDKNSGYDSRIISGAGAAFLYITSSYLFSATLVLDVARVAIESNALSRGWR